MGLQGVELILCGYNTPLHYAPDPCQDPLQGFHNQLVMSAGAYQNGTFVVGVAKGGVEEGVDSLAESSIFAPSGELLAKAATERRRGDRRRVRPRLVQAVHRDAVRLRQVPPPRAVRPRRRLRPETPYPGSVTTHPNRLPRRSSTMRSSECAAVGDGSRRRGAAARGPVRPRRAGHGRGTGRASRRHRRRPRCTGRCRTSRRSVSIEHVHLGHGPAAYRWAGGEPSRGV